MDWQDAVLWCAEPCMRRDANVAKICAEGDVDGHWTLRVPLGASSYALSVVSRDRGFLC